MKLFIERLKAVTTFLPLTTMCLIAFSVSYLMSVISPTIAAAIASVLFIVLIALLLIPIYAFFHWLIIEPFFTKKGVDRK